MSKFASDDPMNGTGVSQKITDQRTGLTTSEAPLAEVKVLDLANATGQYCGKVLAELGADVIKVEPPGGDAARRIGPFYGGHKHPEKSLFWLHFNANKRSITLSIESAEGREILRRLASHADILIETFPPDVLHDLGLGWSALNHLNPRLILTSITPFGQTGPWRKYQNSDLVALALGGLLYQCGWPDRAPVRLGGFQSYHLASLHAATGTLMALYHRVLTGKGQHVDVSMQESIPIALMTTIPEYVATGQVRTRNGDDHSMAATGIFPCKDGYVDFRLRNQHWKEFVDWLDSYEAAEDLVEKKWEDPWNRVRPVDVQHIDSVFRPFLRRFKKNEIYAEGLKRGFEIGPVNSAEDIARDPQLVERHFFEQVQDPAFGAKLRMPRGPYKLGNSQLPARKPAPRTGEHNEEVYCGELGFAKEDYLRLGKLGVI